MFNSTVQPYRTFPYPNIWCNICSSFFSLLVVSPFHFSISLLPECHMVRPSNSLFFRNEWRKKQCVRVCGVCVQRMKMNEKRCEKPHSEKKYEKKKHTNYKMYTHSWRYSIGVWVWVCVWVVTVNLSITIWYLLLATYKVTDCSFVYYMCSHVCAVCLWRSKSNICALSAH